MTNPNLFRRKLLALDYQGAEDFNIEDVNELRKVIVWLEDQKVRHYKIEDRTGLRSGDWNSSLKQYLTDLGCPWPEDDAGCYLDWLLGVAVKLEYGDNLDKYRVTTGGADATAKKPSNPLDSIDFESADFKAGVASLATLLQIPRHIDHHIVLQAVCVMIRERFGKDTMHGMAERCKLATDASKSLSLSEVTLGFETNDLIDAEAAKILRLMHVKELRALQTNINEAIVKVQAITANPKTDARLGKVGR